MVGDVAKSRKERNMKTERVASRGTVSVRRFVLGTILAATLATLSLLLVADEAVPLDGRGGGLIAFYSQRDGDSEILIMNADGTGLRQLTDNACSDDAPSLSPDGTRIAFVSERTGNPEIFVMDLADGSIRQLTDTPDFESHPEWSPDGARIACTRYSGNSWTHGDLFVIGADGQGERRLTSDPADDMRPAWFADGSRLLFSSNRDGNYEIYQIGVDGTGLRRVTDTPLHELFPRPSPDGTKIVYTLGDFGRRQFAVHVMDSDAANDQVLTIAGSHVSGEDAVWADEGERILFQTDRTGNFEIFAMNADGSEQVNLTNLRSGEYWPTWAPVTNRP
jgi:Tol biopolymer transport system component